MEQEENHRKLISYDPILGVRQHIREQDELSVYDNYGGCIGDFVTQCRKAISLTNHNNRSLAQCIIETLSQECCYQLETLGYYDEVEIINNVGSIAKAVVVGKMLENISPNSISSRISYLIHRCKNLLQNNFIITKRE